ncbi:uncharacterized protein METZ01_LOCUS77410 [marine metagenome]|uniref:FtsK domain-containing protein n=1 Tax=marine metagenome TaxID=408172 RepID=A0A381U8L6_9ZZZZ
MNENIDDTQPKIIPFNPSIILFWVAVAAVCASSIIATAFFEPLIPRFLNGYISSFVEWTGLGIVLPCLWLIAIGIVSGLQKIKRVGSDYPRQIVGAFVITGSLWGAISFIHFTDYGIISNIGNGSIGGEVGLHIIGGNTLMGWLRIFLLFYAGLVIIKPPILVKSWQIMILFLWSLGLAAKFVYLRILNKKSQKNMSETKESKRFVPMPPEVLTPHIKESQIINSAPVGKKSSMGNSLIETAIKNPILPNSPPTTDDLLSSYISSSNVTINQLTQTGEGSTAPADEPALEPIQAEPDLINTESTTSQSNKFNKYWSKSSPKEDPSLKTDSQINNLAEFEADPDLGRDKKLNNPLPNSASVSTSWKLPDMKLLSGISEGGISKEEIRDTADIIKNTFADYKIEVAVEKVRPGPTVTMYGIQPGWVRKVKRVKSRDKDGNLEIDTNGKPVMVQQEEKTRISVDAILRREKDLSLALKTPSLRIETPVMGESLLGIEVPNHTPSLVALKNVMESRPYTSLSKKSQLPVALGKGSDGEEVSFDLSKMPHLLIAGATGSGKSVCINAIITGLIMEKDPSEMQMLLIDPKRVELTPYNGIPHLMTPVIVETDKVVGILKGLIQEMMSRYRRMEETGVRNIESFNNKSSVKMPYIVVAIDELADLMMTAAFDIEQSICRLAQLGRSTGIHLIVATQRPSVDVITGLIKANFPSRISFAVTSQIDSRTILDTMGAERLLGRGDMLYQPIDATRPARVQNVFIGDDEIGDIVHHWSTTPRGYKAEIDLNIFSDENSHTIGVSDPSGANTQDELFEKATQLAQKNTKMSTSLLQRRLRIGYPRAARLMDELEDMGVVGPGDGSKSRDVISST